MQISRIGANNYKSFENLLVDSAKQEVENGGVAVLLGLVEDKTAVGAIAVRIENGDLRILSLYVAPEYRRKGGATLLLDTVADYSHDYAVALVADFAVGTPDTIALREFFKAYGFEKKIITGNGMYKLKLSDIIKSDYYKENSDFGRRFSELDEFKYAKLSKYAVAMEGYYPEDGFDSYKIDKGTSIACYEENELKGYIIIEKLAEGVFSVPGILNTGSELNTSMLMKRAFTELKNSYGEDLEIIVEPVDDVILGFVRLVPKAENVACSMSMNI